MLPTDDTIPPAKPGQPTDPNELGDYTAGRDALFAGQTLDQIVSDIKRGGPPPEDG